MNDLGGTRMYRFFHILRLGNPCFSFSILMCVDKRNVHVGNATSNGHKHAFSRPVYDSCGVPLWFLRVNKKCVSLIL
jgi:hypothetical protein